MYYVGDKSTRQNKNITGNGDQSKYQSRQNNWGTMKIKIIVITTIYLRRNEKSMKEIKDSTEKRQNPSTLHING